MRKHGWQLPYHPLQVMLLFLVCVFPLVFWIGYDFFRFTAAGGSNSCFSCAGVCFLCFLCPICWEEAVSVCSNGALHSSEDYKEQFLSKECKQEGLTKELNVETTAGKQLDGCIDSDAARDELHSRVESERLPGSTITWLGISTYDYIIALREQEQEQEQHAVGEQQSPQMSQEVSFFSQFDVVPPEIGTSANHTSKKMMAEEPVKRKNAGTVKISPWTLARLNAEEVSKAAAQARKKSKILQPIVRRDNLQGQDTESSLGSGSGRIVLRSDNRRRMNKRGRVPLDLPLESLAKISASATESNASDLAPETSTGLAPLQLEARSAFRPSKPMPSARVVASSPDSSLDSPDLHPFRDSSSGAEEAQGISSISITGIIPPNGIQRSRSASDGYEASGGEDSDRIPSRIVHRSSNWASIVLTSEHSQIADDMKASSSSASLL
ncbi:hypothetical protein B296_00005422 [Ensete ventricosum]|uniref:Uncharacterized protein n=1 Tax=Ensete ventricosum TaxID=4639 RepID=A0A427AW72_ENSVE|nr:hypothetical protein B296_00005422 [Ensete ventricosum]